ncbi:MAG: sugar transferase [Bacteroidales bacterium]|jgi:exopolysaccharide biosynthesis polyprenyl glycosylphosphotransferase|nr:sugar transferase [Bacteroidales bacterium]
MNKKLQTIKYVIFDVLSSMIAWSLFFIFRKTSIESGNFEDINAVFADNNFYYGLAIIPLFWLTLYYVQGYYQNIYRKSRLKDFFQTFLTCFLGVIVIFFALLLDDNVTTYKNYYLSFFILFSLHFVLTYLPRLIITTIKVHNVHNHKIYFPTIIVGDGEKALKIYTDLQNEEITSGNKIIGYINKNGKKNDFFSLQYLGAINQLTEIISQYKIEEIIIALEQEEENEIFDIICLAGQDVEIKIPADRKDILMGNVKSNAIFNTPLITVTQGLMAPWQQILKRIFDILISLIAIIILSPLYLITSIIVYTTSKGPIFYKQERIGYKGKPFYMHKFRSMYTNAESNGPMLSSGDKDPRITPFGRFMRKVRLDEIPQFYNVLKGTMSIVGPRPERQFFIDQIVKKAPEYRLLHRIKPGITSWGQVKYGYAESVDEMVERLKYDLIYLENPSLSTDIKILFYTAVIILQGRGK